MDFHMANLTCIDISKILRQKRSNKIFDNIIQFEWKSYVGNRNMTCRSYLKDK